MSTDKNVFLLPAARTRPRGERKTAFPLLRLTHLHSFLNTIITTATAMITDDHCNNEDNNNND